MPGNIFGDYLLDVKLFCCAGTVDVSVNLSRLYGSSTFKDIRADVEMQIYDVLNNKMDEFLSLAHYDWSPATVKLQPSSYLVDLIAYLQVHNIMSDNEKFTLPACCLYSTSVFILNFPP